MLRRYADQISAATIAISGDTQFGDLLVILRPKSADDPELKLDSLRYVSDEQRPETMIAVPQS
jgi:hypothetical protein